MYTNLTFWGGKKRKKKREMLYAVFHLLLYTLFNINANRIVLMILVA